MTTNNLCRPIHISVTQGGWNGFGGVSGVTAISGTTAFTGQVLYFTGAAVNSIMPSISFEWDVLP